MAAKIRLLRPTDAAELFALRRRALLDTPEAFLASPEDGVASSESAVGGQLERGPTSAGSARRLYEKVGFRVWGVEPDALRNGDRSIPERHMALSLAAIGFTRR